MERWLDNLLTRQFEKRKTTTKTTTTKQRIESNFDIEFRGVIWNCWNNSTWSKNK